jgi:hypothetical protein
MQSGPYGPPGLVRKHTPTSTDHFLPDEGIDQLWTDHWRAGDWDVVALQVAWVALGAFSAEPNANITYHQSKAQTVNKITKPPKRTEG